MGKTSLIRVCLLFAVIASAVAQPVQSPGLDVIGFGSDSFLVPDGIFLEPVVDHRITVVEGSSVRQYAKNLSVYAGLKMNGFFFKGSIDTNIDTSESGSSSRYFYTYMDSNNMWRISLDTINIERLKSTLIPTVRADINNLDPAKLFAAHGTHYIASAYLRGRADYTAVSTASEKVSVASIRVAVEADYRMISGSSELNKDH